jgi:anti-sigma28 factor (negative regulator of flagellin synthesis)
MRLADMKVNNPNVSNNSAVGVGKAQQTEAASQSSRVSRGASPHGGASDSVQMSNLASVLNGESVNRALRVEHLSDLVQSGRYEVDSHAVGKAMVKHAFASEE